MNCGFSFSSNLNPSLKAILHKINKQRNEGSIKASFVTLSKQNSEKKFTFSSTIKFYNTSDPKAQNLPMNNLSHLGKHVKRTNCINQHLESDLEILYFIFERHLEIQNNFLISKNLKFKDIYSRLWKEHRIS